MCKNNYFENKLLCFLLNHFICLFYLFHWPWLQGEVVSRKHFVTVKPNNVSYLELQNNFGRCSPTAAFLLLKCIIYLILPFLPFSQHPLTNNKYCSDFLCAERSKNVLKTFGTKILGYDEWKNWSSWDNRSIHLMAKGKDSGSKGNKLADRSVMKRSLLDGLHRLAQKPWGRGQFIILLLFLHAWLPILLLRMVYLWDIINF